MKFLKSIRTVTAVAALCLAATTVAQAQNYKIAFIARAQADSFAAWLANGIMDEVKKYPDMTVDVMDSQADDAKENAFIENAVANKYDLIIVQPNNGEAQRPMSSRPSRMASRSSRRTPASRTSPARRRSTPIRMSRLP